MMKRLLLIAILGCSAVLGQAPEGTVSGQVRDSNGKIAGPVRVVLSRWDQNRAVIVMSAQTNDQGVFRFDRVPSGEYTVVAGALMTSLLPGTVDAVQAIVVTPSVGVPAARAGGTYFPGTSDVSQARTVTVTDSANIQNINFNLAVGGSWTDPMPRTIRGRIVVEGGVKPTLRSNQFGLRFSDGPANFTATVTFLDGPRRTDAPSTRLEALSGGPKSMVGFVPLPAFPDAEFKVSIPEGEYLVSVATPPAPPPGMRSSLGTHYVKGVSFGAVDIMKNLMTVKTPISDTLVITLAPCTTTTRDPLCP
jgi:hypothetical protein